MNKRVVCFHLLNNYTGSPKVLSQVVRGLLNKGYAVDLVTNKSEGFLSNINGVRYHYISYQWGKSKISTLLSLLFAQIQFFFITIKINKKGSLFYVNTLLPFGAAWACKMSGRKLLYHVHEKSVTNSLFYKFLQWSYFKCSTKSIFVSNYLQTTYSVVNDYKIILNSLDEEFIEKATRFLNNKESKPNTILLVASGRKYKGIYEFLNLSRKLPYYSFELVMSCSKNEYDEFIINNNIPPNLKVFANQTNLHTFYQRAKLVLNLSIMTEWVETFGLTILEAMAYGIPSIVPPVGGPTELVKDNYNGYLVDSTNSKLLVDKVDSLMKDEQLYKTMSNNALLRSKDFSLKKMIDNVDNCIKDMINK